MTSLWIGSGRKESLDMNQQVALGIVFCWAFSMTACTSPVTPTLSADSLQVTSFTVKPNPVERGDSVTITWHITGASQVTLWQLRYESKIGYWPRRHEPEATSPAAGEWTVTVPFDATWQRTSDQNQPHWDVKFELEAVDVFGNNVTVTGEEIRFVCHPLFFDAGVPWPTCAHEPQFTEATFQPFEHGYMIWRADTGQVYVLPQRPEHPTQWRTHLPAGRVVDVGVPPTGLYVPGGHFQEAWNQPDEDWPRLLGWATAPEQAYALTWQLSPLGGHPIAGQDDLYFLWPDGRVARLAVYLSAPNYDHGPTWGFIGETKDQEDQ